jgi:hypothetical protein
LVWAKAAAAVLTTKAKTTVNWAKTTPENRKVKPRLLSKKEPGGWRKKRRRAVPTAMGESTNGKSKSQAKATFQRLWLRAKKYAAGTPRSKATRVARQAAARLKSRGERRA